MRIIAGSLGGRQFASPHGHSTHPMSDKIRGAMFNMLGDVAGLTVFDPYAGTGAASFEALSRGAKHATMVELDKAAQQTIKQNIESLGLGDQISFFPGNCIRWSARYSDQLFDIVICDPPYDRVLIGTIEKLARHVRDNGLLVLSWPSHLGEEKLNGFTLMRNTRYGNAQLLIYKKSV